MDRRRLPLLLLCAALGSAGRLSARPGNEAPIPRPSGSGNSVNPSGLSGEGSLLSVGAEAA